VAAGRALIALKNSGSWHRWIPPVSAIPTRLFVLGFLFFAAWFPDLPFGLASKRRGAAENPAFQLMPMPQGCDSLCLTT
jgi:hypothetical protein